MNFIVSFYYSKIVGPDLTYTTPVDNYYYTYSIV